MEKQAYILISILVLAVIFFVLLFLRRRKPGNKTTKLGAFSLFLVLAGIIFGESRLVGYSLIGVGVILAVVDIFLRANKK